MGISGRFHFGSSREVARLDVGGDLLSVELGARHKRSKQLIVPTAAVV